MGCHLRGLLLCCLKKVRLWVWGYFLSISSISVPSGSSMKAMVGPSGLRVYGSSVIVTLFFRSVSMVFCMFWTVNARWSKMRFS